MVAEIRASITPPELELVGSDSVRQVSQRFGHETQGELIWFTLCSLTLTRRETFKVLIRPAIDNPDVSSLQFILDESQRERWETNVEPLLADVTDDDTSIDVYWRSIDESTASHLRDLARRYRLQSR